MPALNAVMRTAPPTAAMIDAFQLIFMTSPMNDPASVLVGVRMLPVMACGTITTLTVHVGTLLRLLVRHYSMRMQCLEHVCHAPLADSLERDAHHPGGTETDIVPLLPGRVGRNAAHDGRSSGSPAATRIRFHSLAMSVIR